MKQAVASGPMVIVAILNDAERACDFDDDVRDLAVIVLDARQLLRRVVADEVGFDKYYSQEHNEEEARIAAIERWLEGRPSAS